MYLQELKEFFFCKEENKKHLIIRIKIIFKSSLKHNVRHSFSHSYFNTFL